MTFDSWKQRCLELIGASKDVPLSTFDPLEDAYRIGVTPEVVAAKFKKSMAKERRKALRVNGGCVLTRKNRKTGVEVGLEFNPGEDPDCQWETVCYTHGRVTGHATRKDANSFLSAPASWCGVCAGTEDDEGP